MRATCPPPPPRRLAGSVDCAGPRGGLRLACWGRSRRHTGKVTSVRARAGARGPRGPRCGGLCAGRSPALPPSVSATSSVPGQQQPASPLRRPRREVTAPALPACCGSPWGACGPASTSRAVPKETLGSGPAHLGKLQTTSWGRGGGAAISRARTGLLVQTRGAGGKAYILFHFCQNQSNCTKRNIIS